MLYWNHWFMLFKRDHSTGHEKYEQHRKYCVRYSRGMMSSQSLPWIIQLHPSCLSVHFSRVSCFVHSSSQSNRRTRRDYKKRSDGSTLIALHYLLLILFSISSLVLILRKRWLNWSSFRHRGRHRLPFPFLVVLMEDNFQSPALTTLFLLLKQPSLWREENTDWKRRSKKDSFTSITVRKE
jgi:hypothetical protein